MVEKLDGPAREAGIAAATARGWATHGERDAITKTYQFKDFEAAFAWMTKVAAIAEAMNHHPEWFNVYRTVEVTLATHDVGGLSPLDIEMAEKMDAAV